MSRRFFHMQIKLVLPILRYLWKYIEMELGKYYACISTFSTNINIFNFIFHEHFELPLCLQSTRTDRLTVLFQFWAAWRLMHTNTQLHYFECYVYLKCLPFLCHWQHNHRNICSFHSITALAQLPTFLSLNRNIFAKSWG